MKLKKRESRMKEYLEKRERFLKIKKKIQEKNKINSEILFNKIIKYNVINEKKLKQQIESLCKDFDRIMKQLNNKELTKKQNDSQIINNLNIIESKFFNFVLNTSDIIEFNVNAVKNS